MGPSVMHMLVTPCGQMRLQSQVSGVFIGSCVGERVSKKAVLVEPCPEVFVGSKSHAFVIAVFFLIRPGTCPWRPAAVIW